MIKKGRLDSLFSRRNFLRRMGWAPAFLLSSPLRPSRIAPAFLGSSSKDTQPPPPADFRLTPHYRVQSPLDKVLLKVASENDAYPSEKYASEIREILNAWRKGLEESVPAQRVLAASLEPTIESTPLIPIREEALRDGGELKVYRRHFSAETESGSEAFLKSWSSYLASLSSLETAEFEITSIRRIEGRANPTVEAQLRYDLVGSGTGGAREERLGAWLTEWARNDSNPWRVGSWKASQETLIRTPGPAFRDITAFALGQTESYKKQMLRGVDDWRTVLDGACGIDVYGNNGVAVGDFDGDGFDDFYVCQPSGLPNRLYRNRGDGTFEDATEGAGVGVLDGTSSALFADFTNNGLEDLLVVTGSGPLFFLNHGGGKFALQRDAFRFPQPPQGTFTGAAVADYDRDGLLDVYFCVYSYYLGLDQYHYPVPYFDAQNGPPNFLFHNEGNATFSDRTAVSGLNANNHRYSFACAWSDFNNDGFPDLYVANDFGRKNLYRNNGDGTFTDIASEAGVEDIGAGMSASWFDYDNDGNQDVYVADMWSSAGMRITGQTAFQENCPRNVRALYQKHARGNSLFQNKGNGRFEDVSARTGVEMGRWAWSSDAWDFDHDGYADLYIANGYISGPLSHDLASFFWRQVVAQSPLEAVPAEPYEQGWNAINELIRSDSTWNGYERNVFYVNNRDGTFSEASGAAGLDFPEDGRAFALADFDRDGRLEVVLKNRNAPQLRLLHNRMRELGDSIVFRLQGQKSNRDAIGAAVTVDTGGHRQTKILQAGSGFLSQHTKELFFGLGTFRGSLRATLRWPSGLTQEFGNLPANHRIEIQEGSAKFEAKPFQSSLEALTQSGVPEEPQPPQTSVETWLIEPLVAPDFSLPDLQGRIHSLQSFRGRPILLNFWATGAPACEGELRRLEKFLPSLSSSGIQVVALNVNDPSDGPAVRPFVRARGLTLNVLMASEEVAGVYNVIYRYLFDRRRDLGIPTSMLVDEKGLIIKVYQGPVHPERLLSDLKSRPRSQAERLQRALPFEGTLYGNEFRRNDFTYGVAFFQRGFLEQSAASFEQVIARQPDYPEAYYNLGTLYLKKGDTSKAREYLERAIELRENYPDAWNNLGMIAAQEGRPDEAIRNFRKALLQKPGYAIALENLGNLYRSRGSLAEAEKLLSQALALDPEDPEMNYNLGMLYAQQKDFQRAEDYLEKAVRLRPEYPDALNNLGVLLAREGRPREAAAKFEDAIRVAPELDRAYLNLARIYVILGEREKAGEVLRQLLRRQPRNKAALEALDQLRQ